MLAAIVASSDDAIVSKDFNGIVTSWNQAAERIFGYTAEEMIGQTILRLIPPERPDEEPGILERLRRGERIDHYETVRVRKDGERINVSVTISPIRDETGRLVGASKVARDITQQKRMEAELRARAEEIARQNEELKRADQEKDRFISMLAHELRNPLAPIMTSVEVMRRLDSDGLLDRPRRVIERQVRHLVRLVDDLLDVTRISHGKVTLRRERLDLVRVVRNATEDRRASVEGRGVRVELRLPETPVWVTGDATRLDQILDNLLENAAKFTEEHGRITVSLAREGECAEIRVKDTGIGIEPELLPRLFEVFTQADRTLERNRGGLGLGLAIVQGLVELHGGTITGHSDGIGKGAEFRVRLPVEAELPALLGSPPDPANRARLRAKVLVVEDNRDAAEMLADLLNLFGYEVEVAHSGTEGVAAAHRFHPEIVLCDIGLPGLDGYAVARQLRGAPDTCGTRLIAVTGYGSDEDRQMTLHAGFDSHLVKPVDPKKLLEQLGATRDN
jgi:two-component system CheB/CheR fusion protein